MTGLFDNIHAGLDQQGAIDILSKEVGILESESDYYMAISHLINFPCLLYTSDAADES